MRFMSLMSLMSKGNDIMRLEHHLVRGYVRYISPHIIIMEKDGWTTFE